MIKLTDKAERALLFLYVLKKGLPPNWQGKTEELDVQLAVFGKISGISEPDVASAFAELEDAGMVDR